MDAYFDIFSGISGNMVLGALLELGLDLDSLEEELEKLGLSDEYKIEVEKVLKEGIGGTHVEVKLIEHHHEHEHDHEHEHNHEHEHDHHHHHHHDHHHGRHLDDINKLIEESSLSESIKEKSKAIFLKLAKAEAKIHGKDLNEIHFHEVGAVDAIVDIVGSVIGLELLGVERIIASRLHIGTGFVHCAHGKMPVPAPATMEILEGLPVYSTGIESELVTPTGAAIIATLAEEFTNRPEMEIKKTGYGAGTRELEIPNLLRINLGHFKSKKKVKS